MIRRVKMTPAQVFCIAGGVDLIHGLRRLVWDVGPMSALEQIEFGLVALLLAGLFAGMRRCRTTKASGMAGAEGGK